MPRSLRRTVPLPEEMDARCSHLRRGWYCGSQRFAEASLKLAQAALGRGRSRAHRASPERKAHDALRAGELLREGLRAAGFAAQEARGLPGSDPRKVAIARIIWEQTTAPQNWLAEQLGMGSAANVSQQLRRHRAQQPAKLPRALQNWMEAVRKC